jgi:hypothetical protein
MRSLRIPFFILFFGLGLFNSCDSGPSEETIIKRSLPDTLSARQRFIARQVDLGDIRKQEEFEMRLWIKPTTNNTQEVIVITAIGSSFICEKINLTYSEEKFPPQAEYGLKPKVESFSINVAIPIIPIDSLIALIEPEDPRTLIHQDLLDGFEERDVDGIQYEFEYALGEKRGNFRFHCPELYMDEFEECARMQRIILAFEKAFGAHQLQHTPCSHHL